MSYITDNNYENFSNNYTPCILQAVRDNTGERKIYENHVNKTTEDWLKVYGLEAQKLTLADFTREKERS